MEEEKKREEEVQKDIENTPKGTGKKEVEEGKQIAWLSYLSVLVIVPLMVNPKNEFIKFHARQGITILLFEIAWIFINIILQQIPIIRIIASILSFFIWIGFLVLSIMGLINAIQGEWKKLPFAGEVGDALKII